MLFFLPYCISMKHEPLTFTCTNTPNASPLYDMHAAGIGVIVVDLCFLSSITPPPLTRVENLPSTVCTQLSSTANFFCLQQQLICHGCIFCFFCWFVPLQLRR
ncbi:Hypothetical protein, putative [Bodo saltans]|uniref:Uncharacterized protein n=1 Tax=Bodo saltans TaxID=75058 RepID=A0A0S4KPL7_BODSA|nr:Hypothetical protein, putative [Bodo saltans]|eukprot:CUI15575.1 Hypothetical protein, putative [Bodo saltans]